MKCSSDKEKENKNEENEKNRNRTVHRIGSNLFNRFRICPFRYFWWKDPDVHDGVMAGIVSYFFGGFGTAVRMAGKIAKWGWLIVPFPYDIVTGMVSFFISIMVFIGLPIIPIRKAYKEQMLDAEVVE